MYFLLWEQIVAPQAKGFPRYNKILDTWKYTGVEQQWSRPLLYDTTALSFVYEAHRQLLIIHYVNPWV